MTSIEYQVVGVGNALVDILSHEDDGFLSGIGLEKGAATMVDADASEALYARMGPAAEVSGGSAANTVAGVASFGGTAAFVGRVGDDTFGRVFSHDLRSVGVHFDGAVAADGTPTGRCLVVVTPDAQRTMCTYLGAACDLDPESVDPDLVRASAVTYLEGYLWDQPLAKAAIRRAARAAHEGGRRGALTLSDPFCVERHRAEFRVLLEGSVDVLFANEHEICSLYEVDDLDAAMHRVRGHCEIAALTRGPLGSVVVTRDDVHVIDPHPVAQVVDTTGAGDLYAAGFLHGLTAGLDLASCGRLGSLAAAEVISHLGARPLQPLALHAAEVLER